MSELKESTIEKLPPAKKTSRGKTNVFAFLLRHWIIVSLVLIVLLIPLNLWLLINGIGVGAKATAGRYLDSYKEENDAAYQNYYQISYDRAEKNYHVSNRVIISIGDLEESEKLEVLKASDVEFITENRDSNSGKVTAWLEVTGEGTFVVDLKAAEFIVDHGRRYVLVRIPYPELTNMTITDAVKRFFKDDLFNGSYSEGVDLALKQRNEASLRIHKALMSNQYIYSSAQDVAKSMLGNLIKQFNPDIPDLIVEVEFMD